MLISFLCIGFWLIKTYINLQNHARSFTYHPLRFVSIRKKGGRGERIVANLFRKSKLMFYTYRLITTCLWTLLFLCQRGGKKMCATIGINTADKQPTLGKASCGSSDVPLMSMYKGHICMQFLSGHVLLFFYLPHQFSYKEVSTLIVSLPLQISSWERLQPCDLIVYLHL